MKSSHIGILILERESGRQVGLIEFQRSGMLGFQVLQRGLHVFALKPIEGVLSETAFGEPLYVKYAALLKRRDGLGRTVLLREARRGANAINCSKRLLRGNTIRARMVEYHDGAAVPTK